MLQVILFVFILGLDCDFLLDLSDFRVILVHRIDLGLLLSFLGLVSSLVQLGNGRGLFATEATKGFEKDFDDLGTQHQVLLDL